VERELSFASWTLEVEAAIEALLERREREASSRDQTSGGGE
jgi:hypothetical protein